MATAGQARVLVTLNHEWRTLPGRGIL